METPNLGLYVLAPDDVTTKTLEWLRRMGTTEADSNMMILDQSVAQLQEQKANKVVESEQAPSGLVVGDEWDELLT